MDLQLHDEKGLTGRRSLALLRGMMVMMVDSSRGGDGAGGSESERQKRSCVDCEG